MSPLLAQSGHRWDFAECRLMTRAGRQQAYFDVVHNASSLCKMGPMKPRQGRGLVCLAGVTKQTGQMNQLRAKHLTQTNYEILSRRN
jgi:hypothetical protein